MQGESWSPKTLEWAKQKFKDDVQALADDPHGYLGQDLNLRMVMDDLKRVAWDLCVDFDQVLVEVATLSERDRLAAMLATVT